MNAHGAVVVMLILAMGLCSCDSSDRPGSGSPRQDITMFVAKFDSVFTEDVEPEINESVVFEEYEIDGLRQHLTLKMGSSAWDRMTYIQKKNVVVHMLVAFFGARSEAALATVQSGGPAVDASDCEISIEDMWGEKYAEASLEHSAKAGSIQSEDIKIYK